MTDNRRTGRVAAEIRGALTELLADLSDPRVGSITVTSVRVSRDLRVAWIDILPLGGVGDRDAVMAGLSSAGGFLRSRIARRVRLRYVPELRFAIDRDFDTAEDLSARLARQERTRAADTPEEPA